MENLKSCEVKLEISSTVTRVTQNGRRLPHSMRKKVNEKLKEMKEQDIIEKVDGMTPWLSPLIPIPKKGDYSPRHTSPQLIAREAENSILYRR